MKIERITINPSRNGRATLTRLSILSTKTNEVELASSRQLMHAQIARPKLYPSPQKNKTTHEALLYLPFKPNFFPRNHNLLQLQDSQVQPKINPS